MESEAAGLARSGPPNSSRSVPAYAASVWAFAFAVPSFYWAMGGNVGSETIGPAITELAAIGDPEFVAVLWATAVLKVTAGLLALALVQPSGHMVPRLLLLAAGWVASGLLVLYGAASFVQHGLMLAGAVNLPPGLGETAARWHLLLWDPWFVLGGVLFAAATRNYASRAARGRTEPGAVDRPT